MEASHSGDISRVLYTLILLIIQVLLLMSTCQRRLLLPKLPFSVISWHITVSVLNYACVKPRVEDCQTYIMAIKKYEATVRACWISMEKNILGSIDRNWFQQAVSKPDLTKNRTIILLGGKRSLDYPVQPSLMHDAPTASLHVIFFFRLKQLKLQKSHYFLRQPSHFQQFLS